MEKISAGQIFSISGQPEFEHLALKIFQFQAANVQVYADFIKALGIHPENVTKLSEVPYLPIEFFKSHRVMAGDEPATVIFSSSSTGGVPSQHHVKDVRLYENSFRKGFEMFYGDVSTYAVLALLPTYLERDGSSLIYMVNDLIAHSKISESGYFLYDHAELNSTLVHLKNQKIPTVLIGVTYALLDFLENFRVDFPELIIMETGGMKGKRKELIREELHSILYKGFGVSAIHSEYGMTELLSQAYSKGEGIFQCPPWMQISIRDMNDPFGNPPAGQAGGINVIDLANLNSCSFIATQDLGRLYPDNHFEVLGRFDNSDIRGCNLMIG